MSLVLRLFSGVFVRFWKPIAAFLGGWLVRGQREKIKDLKAEAKTRERMDNAPVHTDVDTADEFLRNRADKRDL